MTDSAEGRLDISGVLIPVTTPFQAGSGDVDLPAFRANLAAFLQHPVRGIVVGGSTGEAVLLELSERMALLEAARETVPPDRLLVAGTGAESTRLTLSLSEAAARVGADAVLVQPPAYYRNAMTPEVLARHYRTVADACPVPVILYQVPLRFSTVELSTGLVAELSEHPNVIGIKDSRGDMDLLAEYVVQTRPRFQVLVGSGARLYAGLEIGAVGGILGVANLMPGECAELHAAFRAGRSVEAGRIQERVGPVHKELVGGLGVAGIKFALDRLGRTGGDPRPPLQSLDARGRERVTAVLQRAGL
jgi:4-hydroxy-2-oxoglutarate aldolase